MKPKMRAIQRKLKSLVGIDIVEPDHDWAAPFGTTTTGLPLIDRVPGQQQMYSIMGFGGNGITFSMIAAQIVASHVLGKPDIDAGLFRFPK